MSFYTYILCSQKCDKYYIGQSRDPERRLIYHNSIEKGFTSRYRPWKLVWKKECATKQEAIVVEQEIKGWKNKRIIQELIEGKREL